MRLGTTEVDTFKCGTDDVDKIYLGTTEVWANFKPFYWIENNVVTSGFPTDFTVTVTQGASYSSEGTNLANGFGVWSPATDIGSKVSGTATAVPTKGAKYMIMEYTYTSGGATEGIYINNVLVPNTVSQYDGPKTKTVVVDISEYNSVVLRMNIGAAPWHSHFSVRFNRIYFTNEI